MNNEKEIKNGLCQMIDVLEWWENKGVNVRVQVFIPSNNASTPKVSVHIIEQPKA